MSDLSQKYGFLLHPIKDLMKNWNVDIAAILEDFQEELEKMTYTFDDGKTKVNFAEAAMLIQGTACVWSRKVESLHNLVYQTLEIIKETGHNKQPTSIDPQGLDNDVTFSNHEDKFLDLDDQPNITSKKLSNDLPNVVCIVRRSPFFQFVKEDRGSPFLNKSQEVTNYYKDFWAHNMVPQDDGIALLENSLDHFKHKTTPPVNETLSKGVLEQEKSVADAQSINFPADEFMNDLGCNDSISVLQEHENTVVENFQRSLRPKPPPEKVIEKTELPSAVEELDPHRECTVWTAKPFRKGKTIKYPPTVQENPKKRKASATVEPPPLFSEFLTAAKKLTRGVDGSSTKKEKIRRNEILKRLQRVRSNVISNFEAARDCEEMEHDDNACGFDDDVPDVDDVTVINVPLDDFQNDLESYEDLVRHHVEQYYSSAKQFVFESALSQRVKEWREMVEPLLAEQDDLPEFNIHQYGDHMLSQFQEVGQVKSFIECVQSNISSICRSFAATLQLANDGNLLLSSSSENLDHAVNSLKMKLQTKERSTERFDDYTPS